MILGLDAARERLRAVAELLEGGRLELLAIKKGLLPTRRERSRVLDLDDDPSASTEMRTVIDCVIHDSLGPAIQDLLDAAAYQPARRPAASGRKGRSGRSGSSKPAGGEIAQSTGQGDRALLQVLLGVEAFKKKGTR